MEKIQGLLRWCQNVTKDYPGVFVKDFTYSWKNGLAFCALIHKFKPELIDYHRLDGENEYYNNSKAFQLAEIHFGIPSLLDPKDMVLMSCPERLSVITYVSQFYNCLKNMKQNGGPDINKFENLQDNNSDFDTISCRASVYKLKNMKCFICQNKVYLLERYVSEDKLYHRQCYRDFQINNFRDSEIIGDYLNIYGELKPTMNKNIFVHPLQGYKSNDEIKLMITHPPINIEKYFSSDNENCDLEGDNSESLSSFSSSDSDKYDVESSECIKAEDNTEILNFIPKIKVKDDLDINCQDNLVLNITKSPLLNPIKPRLYIKKKDKQLPYSTFFKISDHINYTNDLNFYDTKNEKSPEETKIGNLNIMERNNIENILPTNERKILEIKIDSENESDLSSSEENDELEQPVITRNSLWRKPIISSTNYRKHHHASIPIETKYKCYSEFKDRLTNLNEKQSQIECKGRTIQLKLWEEDPMSPEYENLLNTWLELVEEKDKIFYEENALYSWLKDLKLQEIKGNLEYQIRLLSKENNQNENTKDIEGELINKLIETVNRRSELMDAMHEEDMQRSEIVKMRHEALEKSCSFKNKASDIEPVKISKKNI